VVGHRPPVVRGRARPGIARRPVVIATVATWPVRGSRSAATIAGLLAALIAIMTARLGRIAALRAPVVGVSTRTGAVIPSRPAPAATVAVVVPTLGPAIRRTAVAARLAAPTAVTVAVVPPRHGASRGFWVGIIVAMRRIAPMGSAAAVACLPAPSAVVAVTRPTLGPATGRIAVATRHAVPAIEAVAAAPVTMAPVRERTSGRRVAGTRPRDGRPQGRAAGGR